MIDFTELAKLRDSGLTLREISARMGWGKTSVYRALRRYSP
jgi:lambda repressor-like predicted transcriptional regulator